MAESRGSDPLADTALAGGGAVATATSGTADGAAPAGEPPRAIGRYRIDGVLGQGAMGTVYAAHDHDLDRRIALKVLRGGGSEAGRARLLREARAMARLSHPAVVTVYEVATAGGVDHVAMELVDGTTLADWLRREPRPPADAVIEAFITAGRGLAAAHAAGLVHRDFKPHNVLRSRTGRVVVTDFGLARAQLEEPAAAAAAAPDRAADAGSLSSTLTVTGALLGTPAYMAPEQHDGVAAGPAADQFAFCVALWEGLAGERPFAGETLRELRAAIERGPSAATEARIPRQLREPLRRGLAIDPARRWPDMDALLAAIAPRRRGRVIAAAVAGVVAVAASVLIWRGTRDHAVVVPAGCGAADQLVAFHRAGDRARLAAVGPDGARVLASLDRRAVEWSGSHHAVCASPADPELAHRLTCLDAVRSELELALAAAAGLTADSLATVDGVEIVGDPQACAATPVPARIAYPTDPAVIALARHELDDAQPAGPVPADPCLAARWRLAAPLDATNPVPLGADLGDDCRDELIRARVAVARADRTSLSVFGGSPDHRPTERAVARAGGDRMLAAELARARATTSMFHGELGKTIDATVAGVELYEQAGATQTARDLRGELAGFLRMRSAPGDLDRAEHYARDVLAVTAPGRAERYRRVVRKLAEIVWDRGRLAEAHQLVAGLPAVPPAGTLSITGRVVDGAGAPVAGARVAARPSLTSDAVDVDAALDGETAVATTDARGAFTIAHAAADAIVVAGMRDQRSIPMAAAPSLTLRLVDTSSITGRIKRDPEIGAVNLSAMQGVGTAAWSMLAPVGDDGTFTIDHLPPGPYQVVAVVPLVSRPFARSTQIVVGARPAGPVEISLELKGQPVTVLVRNTVAGGFTGAMVFVRPGRVTVRHLGDLVAGSGTPDRLTLQLEGDSHEAAIAFASPPEPGTAVEGYQVGDVVATVAHVEAGDVTVCACGFSGDMQDPAFQRALKDHMGELDVGCVPRVVTAAPGQVVVVEAPPMKRFP